MKLNMDCVRDILLCVESIATPTSFCVFMDIDSFPEFSTESVTERHSYQISLDTAYGNSTLIYHVRYCIDSGLVKTDEETRRAIQNCVVWENLIVLDLSVSGHDLLSKIRDENRWSGVKKALPTIRNYSLDAINALSQGMTSAAISAYLEKGL